MKSFEEITRGIEEIINDENLSLNEKYYKLRENFLITERDICNDEKETDCIEEKTFDKLHQFVKKKIYPKLIRNIKSVEDGNYIIKNFALPIDCGNKWFFNDYEIVSEIYKKLFYEGYLNEASLEDLVMLYNTDEADSCYYLKEELPEVAEEIISQINERVLDYLDKMELDKISYGFEIYPWILDELPQETKSKLKEKINSLSEEEQEEWEEFLEYLED